ncbi:MAG TPA: hypothetical protein VF993_07720, partial [Myxococcales bacterium]
MGGTDAAPGEAAPARRNASLKPKLKCRHFPCVEQKGMEAVMKVLFPIALAAGWITMVAFTLTD